MRKLREYRKKAGLTQQQLAEALGVSKQTVTRWENEPNKAPSNIWDRLPKIAYVLGCKVSDFFQP